MHLFQVNNNSTVARLSIYNNYIYGAWGANLNAAIYIEEDNSGDSMGPHYIFNNVIFMGSGSCASGGIDDNVVGGTTAPS